MRERHEAQIRIYNRLVSLSQYDDGIKAFTKAHGLSWFTDAQIADIRRELISNEWKRRCSRRAHHSQ